MDLKNRIIYFLPLLKQLTRFGIVGVCAASVHFSIVIFLVETNGIKPLIANVAAFLISFQVSYWGHRSWTFSGTTTLHRIALPKLFLVGSCGLVANEGLFYLFLSVLNLPYQLALLFVLTILPIINFTLGKLWIFK